MVRSTTSLLPGSLVEVLRVHAAESPARRAYVFLDREGREAAALSWGELDRRARAVAAALEAQGARGERALLLFPPGLEFIVAFLGCLRAGVVAVPAYPPRPNRSQPRLRAIARDAGARFVLATSSIAGTTDVPELARAAWIATDALAPESGDGWEGFDPEPDAPAFLQYTSGSTSDPKGVVVTHANLVHNEEAIRLGFGQSERSVVVGWLPLYHDMGLIGNVLQPLYTGATAVLMAPLTFLQRPRVWLEAIGRYRATTSGGPDFAYDLCVRKIGEEERAGLDLSSWTVAFNGAEPVRAGTLERFAAAFGPCGFRRKAFFPCYGLAEATLFVSGGDRKTPPVVRAFRADDLERHAAVEAVEPGARKLVGCGRPSEGQRVAIVNPETCAPCASNHVGEIWVAGPSVAAGYWGRPEETARLFRARRADGDGPFLRTGDLGFLDARGELFVTGRLKDLIILRGRNHYPQDFERTAEAVHPALRLGHGAAFSREREGEERLVLVQEVEHGRVPSEELAGLAEAVRRAVAEEHEVGVEEVVLLRANTIPRTSSGKIRRAACRAAYLDGSLSVAARSGSAPAEMVEASPEDGSVAQVLRQEAARALRFEAGAIEPDLPLISFGLDSLAAVELANGVQTRLGVELPLVLLLQGATLDDLIAAVGKTPSAVPEEDRAEQLEYPLSHGQVALWLAERLAPGKAPYNLAGAARVRGDLDVEALARALQTLSGRHPALRTTYEDRSGEPWAKVHERLAVDFREMGAPEADLPDLLRAEAFRPFDLTTGPLLRVRVWRPVDGDPVLLLAIHHLAADFWSLGVMLRELRAQNLSVGAGLAPAREGVNPSPASIGSFTPADHARRERRLLAGPDGERLWMEWRERLAGELPVLDLATDRPRPPVQSHAGVFRTLRLDPVVSHQVRAFAASGGATLHVVLLAAFQAFLYRCSGQPEVMVGVPTAGRSAGFEGVVGYFVNPAPVRTGVSGDLSGADLLARVREGSLAALGAAAFPFALLAERLRPERDASRSPLFQAMLVHQRTQRPDEEGLAGFALGEAGVRVEMGGLTLESLPLPEVRVPCDLLLMTAELDGGLAASLQAASDLFDETTAGRMLACFANLLRGMTDDPARPVAELDLLSEPEWLQLAAWSVASPIANGADGPDCLHRLIAAQVERTPDAPALAHGGRTLGYRELWDRAGRLARRLRASGVGPEARVGVCAERTPGMVAGLLAVLRAGGAYVPLDPAYPAERRAFILEDSRAAVLLTDAELDVGTSQDASPLPDDASPENLAYLIYTSGLTGRPKGVAIEHHSAVAFARWAREVFDEEDWAGVLASTSASFDLSVFELLVPLCWGGRVVLARDALELQALPRELDVRLVNTVPSAMAELVHAGALPPSVRTVNLAGEPLRRELVRALADAGVRRVLNLYGPSEDTTYSTFAVQDPDGEGEPPIGRPVAGTQAWVLDVGLQPVPVGVAGELFLGGAGLARGYLGRPDLTAERFIPDPFGGLGVRLYRTGDRVRRRPDGELVFLGRLDHQVKLRGFRIELGEIEAALLSLPGVREAAVLVLGEGDLRRLVAFVAGGEGLQERLAARLPAYMVPAAFVSLPALPLTPNGKVDRKALARLAPGTEGASGRAPETPEEVLLAEVWTEVLGLERIGAADSFFALGGHSLLAARVQARVRERCGAELPLAAFFQTPALAGLALQLARSAKTALPAPVPLPRDGRAFPLSFAQERLWILERLDPGSAVYHMAGGARLDGPLDVASLRRAVAEVVRRHEALRTSFPEEGGEPVQRIGGSAVELPLVSLTGLPQEIRERQAERLAGEEARKPFDLAAGTPMRSLLLRLGEERHRLLVTIHHIAADEASLEVLVEDLAALYEREELPAPPLQFADFAVWQRERPRWDGLAWWEERLAGLGPLDLPTDRPRSEARGPRGGLETIEAPAELTAGLAALARREGATLFLVLLTGLQTLLGRLAGTDDVAVGSPVSQRSFRELERVVGLFVDTLVLRSDLSGDPRFRELLGRVRETAATAHEHAAVPFERIVDRLRPERSLGRNPLFDVMLALHRPPRRVQAGDLFLEPLQVPIGTARFDLTLFALEREEGLSLTLEYAAELFDRATAVRLLEGLSGLLTAAVADPGLRLSELPVLALAGQRQVLTFRAAPRRWEAPRTPVEQMLAGIWEDLLGVERPGLHDDFFALGGHSLLAVRVGSRLWRALGVELPLNALFEERTLAGLAAWVEAARREALQDAEPLVPVPREAPGLPLSFGQERLWFLDRLDPGSPVYNMPTAVRLRGDLDPEALRRAIEGIAARHEVLRTAFPAPAGEPLQSAAQRLALFLPWVDLSGLEDEAREAEALRLAAVEALRSFDLEAGPPLRATLLRLGDGEHVLLVTVHHIAFDGWSMGVFLRELAALYGGAPELPLLAVQYADFAAWQRRRLAGEALERQIAWWRERLAGAPPVLALSLDRPRPPVQTFRGGTLRTALAPEAVRALGRRFEATPFMTLLAVWSALLARYTGEVDLTVGTAVAGRDRVELEPLIGLFAENLVLRMDLAGDPGFPEILARAREAVLSAWAHREVPFERLVREVRPERDLSHTPFYQAVLTLDASDRPPLELPGLRLEFLPVESGTAKFDLALYLEDRRGGVTGLLEFNRDLFDRSTVERLLAAFERLVEAVPLDPERRLSELPVLSETERCQLESGVGEGFTPSRAGTSPAPTLQSRWTDLQAPAVSGGGRTLSSDELERQAGRLAGRLRDLGVGPEVRVAVFLDRSPGLIVALLGIWKAGGVYVPLDPAHPEERLAWMVADSQAAVVLASRTGPVPPPTTAVLFLEDLPEGEVPAVPLLPESAAYLIYTSGSTGLPKGVVVPHGALAAYSAAVAGLYGIGPGDRVIQSASIGFDLSLDEIVPCLAGGAELVLRDDAMLASPALFLQGCRERGITVVSLPTAFWHEIAARLEVEELALPPTLRLVILGGERLLPERLAAWRLRFPDGPRLLNTYGPTEATIMVTAVELTTATAPLGRPLPGVGIWLLGRWGELVPPGVAGEVCVGGGFLARGYLGRPDRTAERFVPHPFPPEPGARLYRTGDLARLLPDGNLEFVGRTDEQVKVRGYRVEPGEVEAVLARHPEVAAAAVIPWEEEPGKKRLVGYVVPRSAPPPDLSEVRAFLAAQLPEPLVPSELVFLEALPLTPHGKVDRRALPAPTGRGVTTEHVAPRDEMEREIAAIWREALGVERVGIHDNFFDLGGHSLLLARVHLLLGERLGREVPVVDLFRHPTVASLAQRLSPQAPSAPLPVERVRERAERSRAATRQGRFLEARKRLAVPPALPRPAAPWDAAAEAAHTRLSRASASWLRFAAAYPESLERDSFAALADHAAGSPYPLQPWPALVDRARVAGMERVSVGLVRLVKSLPRRVFGDDPERLRDFYDLASSDIARSMVEEPNGLQGAVGRGDFLDSRSGFQCLELNLVSDLGGWQAPLWAEGYPRVPVFARFLREEGLRAVCRDTVSLLFAHAVAEARELGKSDGEIHVALVMPEGAGAVAQSLEPWLSARYAEALRREAPGAAGSLVLSSYTGLKERGGRLWAGERRVHAAVEVHHEGTAAQAFRCFKAGTLKLFNAPVRAVLTDKRNLALLSELADRGEVLEPAERELVTRHVPWTRRLAAAEVSWRGGTAWLPELAVAARRELVIKRARAGQGSAVHLGIATPEPEWRERVARALTEGDWIVQERVEPLPFIHQRIHQRGERGAGPHDVVWGLFVFGDRYGGGFLSLAPREDAGVVNLTRGASAGVIFEVLDE